MTSQRQQADVIVVGAGVIGLAVAWRACERGLRVTLLERAEAGAGTSRVAAGMLAPVSEVEFGSGGEQLLELGMRSVALWPEFATQLEAASEQSVGLLRRGTLMLARDADEARELERQISLRQSLGLRAQRLRPSDAREREPALAPTIRLALELPDDHSADPRLVLAALRSACASLGVHVREHCEVAELLERESAVCGVRLRNAERVLAGAVVVAAGSWSGQLAPGGGERALRVRPVKGQTLRLRDPAGPGLLQRPIRYEGGYLVPRADGRYVLGATVEERGFDMASTAGATYELLRDCHELVPGISELEIEELCVGVRPGTPDNVPAVGRDSRAGLIWATGHYRNGILLAPLTARLVVDLLTDDTPEQRLLAICDPARLGDGMRPRARNGAERLKPAAQRAQAGVAR